MTLQELGSLGELVGGVAVVVSLLYLAVEIRHHTRGLDQNKEFMRLSFENEIRRETANFRSMIATDADLADLWRRGLTGEAKLDSAERLRFGYLLVNITSFLRAQFAARSRGLYSYEIGVFLRTVVRTPGFREWWSTQRELADPKYVEFIDEIISASELR